MKFQDFYGGCLLLLFSKLSTGMTGKASYNSFRNQVGFCKLQGFDTISRETAHSIPAFMNGDILMGVGLNHFQFMHNISNCGRCLQIQSIQNFPVWNPSVTEWTFLESPQFPFLAMVMDECKDPICDYGFLDFDIYSKTQPVALGNPFDVQWEFVDCPMMGSIELLFCFSNTCKESDPMNRTVQQVLDDANPHFWSLSVRNLVKPITFVYIPEYNVYLEPKEGWFWNSGKYEFLDSFSIRLSNDQTFHIDFSTILSTQTIDAYRGGILWRHV